MVDSNRLRLNTRGSEWVVQAKVNFGWTRYGIHNSEVSQKTNLSKNDGIHEIMAPKNSVIVRTDR